MNGESLMSQTSDIRDAVAWVDGWGSIPPHLHRHTGQVGMVYHPEWVNDNIHPSWKDL